MEGIKQQYSYKIITPLELNIIPSVLYATIQNCYSFNYNPSKNVEHLIYISDSYKFSYKINLT
jgi:hypothetical protein